MRTQVVLRRILDHIERLEARMTAASNAVQEALASLDAQFDSLKARLAEDAAGLQQALQSANVARDDEAALFAAADRVNRTAQEIGQLAAPSAVANPEDPATAEPLPPAEEDNSGGGVSNIGDGTDVGGLNTDGTATGAATGTSDTGTEGGSSTLTDGGQTTDSGDGTVAMPGDPAGLPEQSTPAMQPSQE